MATRQVIIAAEIGLSIATLDDIQDALAASFGSAGLLLGETDLAPAVLDLRTRMLGELMQKFVNYRLKLAIVLPEPARYGPRLVELVREHARHPTVRFLPNRASAESWLGTP